MPPLGFTVFKEEVKDGRKRQTIRIHRKRPIKTGDALYLYWHLRRRDCELLREAPCTETFSRTWAEIRDNEDIARRDGFKSAAEMRNWVNEKNKDLSENQLLDIIRW